MTSRGTFKLCRWCPRRTKMRCDLCGAPVCHRRHPYVKLRTCFQIHVESFHQVIDFTRSAVPS